MATMREKFKTAKQQRIDDAEQKRRAEIFKYTPMGQLKRVNEGLAQIADKIEDDLNARISAMKENDSGVIYYRIEKISHLTEPQMKSVQNMPGYAQLHKVCGHPDIDVRVDVTMYHGSLNGGVDIRVYPEHPFKGSSLKMDSTVVAVAGKEPAKKRTRKPAAGPKTDTSPQPHAAREAIPVMRPLVLKH
ncbi:MAG: hypothetical protein ACAH80_15160 [Alphaproteobacteria bacterium]